MVTISARILIRGPPDFEQLAHEHHCPNPGEMAGCRTLTGFMCHLLSQLLASRTHTAGYRLPEPLEDLSEKGSGKPVPFIIDPDIVKREHATYAWYARHVFNMYSYTFKYAGASDHCGC